MAVAISQSPPLAPKQCWETRYVAVNPNDERYKKIIVPNINIADSKQRNSDYLG